MAHRGLTFGIFLAPFHRPGENPTLALERDVELIQWLDSLGYYYSRALRGMGCVRRCQ